MFYVSPADNTVSTTQKVRKAGKDIKQMEIKRSEPRFMCSEPVNILVNDGSALAEGIANLEDISASGACVHLDEAIRVGANIEIVCSTCSFKGTVRNCRYTVAGFDVGMEFAHAKAWNLQRYEPKHLLLVATRVPEEVEVEVGLGARSLSVGVGDFPDFS